MKNDARFLAVSLIIGIGLIAWLRFNPPNQPVPATQKTEQSPFRLRPKVIDGKQQASQPVRAKGRSSPLQNLPFGPNQTGAYRTRAELEAAQDNGEIVWSQITNSANVIHVVRGYALEPYPERTLAALEEVMKNATERKTRLAAAALLYRYGKESGRTALLESVRDHGGDKDSLNAATTLLQNRDAEVLPHVQPLLKGFGWTDSALMDAVGRWSRLELSTILMGNLKERPKYFDFAISLAWQGQNEGLPYLRDALLRKASNGYLQIQLEGSLVRLGQFGAEDFLRHVDEIIVKVRYAEPIGRSLEVAGPRVSTPALLRQLEQYVPKHEEWVAGLDRQVEMARNNDPNTYKSFPISPPTEMMLASVGLLAQWEDKTAVPYLERIIPQLQKRKPDNLVNEQLCLALYKLDPMNWRSTLVSAGIRQDLIDRIPEVAKLRPLAPEFMPQQKYWLSRSAP